MNAAWMGAVFTSAVLLNLTGCSHSNPATSTAAAPGEHKDQPPHGGTVIDLGADLYHLEMLRDPDGGTLTVWVLDGEMEQFIRIAQPTIGLVVNGQSFSLNAVANTATGETVGDTSQFELRGNWVKGAPAFKAQIGPVTVRGTSFPAVSFQFPDGA